MAYAVIPSSSSSLTGERDSIVRKFVEGGEMRVRGNVKREFAQFKWLGWWLHGKCRRIGATQETGTPGRESKSRCGSPIVLDHTKPFEIAEQIAPDGFGGSVTHIVKHRQSNL